MPCPYYKYTMNKKIKVSVEFIKSRISDFSPEFGLVLGSGLGTLAGEIENPIVIKYKDIPEFPITTIEGHAGQFVTGILKGKKVIAMQGRFHYYEGYSMEVLTLPIRLMKKIGVKKLILTNAAGSANTSYIPGDLMLIKDHINFSFANPLIGQNLDEFGLRFPDMSNVYDKEIISLIKKVSKKAGIEVREGVYFYSTGPCYETPSEVKMARTLGADALGMSTVPEAIVGVHSGMKIIGISCITNMASGILNQSLSHNEVIETTERVKEKFKKLIRIILKTITN